MNPRLKRTSENTGRQIPSSNPLKLGLMMSAAVAAFMFSPWTMASAAHGDLLEDDLFADLTPMSNDELSGHRGGISIDGVEFSFAVSATTNIYDTASGTAVLIDTVMVSNTNANPNASGSATNANPNLANVSVTNSNPNVAGSSTNENPNIDFDVAAVTETATAEIDVTSQTDAIIDAGVKVAEALTEVAETVVSDVPSSVSEAFAIELPAETETIPLTTQTPEVKTTVRMDLSGGDVVNTPDDFQVPSIPDAEKIIASVSTEPAVARNDKQPVISQTEPSQPPAADVVVAGLDQSSDSSSGSLNGGEYSVDMAVDGSKVTSVIESSSDYMTFVTTSSVDLEISGVGAIASTGRTFRQISRVSRSLTYLNTLSRY